MGNIDVMISRPGIVGPDVTPANNLEVFDIDVIVTVLIDNVFDSTAVVGINIRELVDNRSRIAVIIINPILE